VTRNFDRMEKSIVGTNRVYSRREWAPISLSWGEESRERQFRREWSGQTFGFCFFVVLGCFLVVCFVFVFCFCFVFGVFVLFMFLLLFFFFFVWILSRG